MGIEENIDKLDEYIVNLDEDDNNQGEEEEDNNEGEEEDDNNKGDKEKKDLKKIIKDFLVDLLGTFPELYDIFDNNLKNIHDNVECDNNISDNSRDIIWKHLQVILFVIIGDIDEKHLFGESQKMFEEVKEKLFETISNIQDMFDLSDGDLKDISGDGILPDPENIHNHLNSLLDGKLGSLAKEIAEETVNDMDLKVDDDADPEEVFNKLFKNPSKLMNMATSVGKKLDSKIKEGTLKESELLEEATELMEKMKNMPGMEKMESLFKNMPGMNGAKIDKNAMQNKLNNNLKTSKMKERMRKKLDERKKDEEKGDEKDREINVENME